MPMNVNIVWTRDTRGSFHHVNVVLIKQFA